MTKRIFWDVDETLIHSEGREFPEHSLTFFLEDGQYWTAVRKQALAAIEYSRVKFGTENVFILSIGTRDYIYELNHKLKWNFPLEQIFAREDILNNLTRIPTAYGGLFEEVAPHVDFMDGNNLLIDNMHPEYNSMKTDFLSIQHCELDKKYLEVDDYYGVNFPNDPFFDRVKEFLDRHTSSV